MSYSKSETYLWSWKNEEFRRSTVHEGSAQHAKSSLITLSSREEVNRKPTIQTNHNPFPRQETRAKTENGQPQTRSENMLTPILPSASPTFVHQHRSRWRERDYRRSEYQCAEQLRCASLVCFCRMPRGERARRERETSMPLLYKDCSRFLEWVLAPRNWIAEQDM